MKKWFVVHTQTGSEEEVKRSLSNQISSSGMNDLFGEIFAPTEQVSEIRRGKKRISERKFFPGYILVNMELTDATYLLIKTTPCVTGFIGSGRGRKPSPLSEAEVENIVKKAEEAQSKPAPKVAFEKGDAVRVLEGPFINFNGAVEDVNPLKQRIKVNLSIFGRSTPVVLEYWQLEKV